MCDRVHLLTALCILCCSTLTLLRWNCVGVILNWLYVLFTTIKDKRIVLVKLICMLYRFSVLCNRVKVILLFAKVMTMFIVFTITKFTMVMTVSMWKLTVMMVITFHMILDVMLS